ncbi:MAG TPA: hypothetical protein VFV08_02070 [Puia sp.]|nr:hypothetical protein [Puia sp.]
MKRKTYIFLGLLLIAISTGSCKKYIQQQEQNALIKLITNGSWIVTRYLDNGTDITATFSGYSFKFNSNGTVAGTNGGTVVDGTWSGDINSKTITSNFPSATDPIAKLNAVWKITDSYTDSVAAKATIDSNINILNLHKQ